MGWKFTFKNSIPFYMEEIVTYEASFEIPVGRDIVSEFNDITSPVNVVFIYCYSYLFDAMIKTLAFKLMSSNTAELELVVSRASWRTEQFSERCPVKLPSVSEHAKTLMKESETLRTMEEDGEGMYEISDFEVFSPKHENKKAFCKISYIAKEGLPIPIVSSNIMEFIIPDSIYEKVLPLISNLNDFKDSSFGIVHYDMELYQIFGSMYNITDTILAKTTMGRLYLMLVQFVIHFETLHQLVYGGGITRSMFTFERGVFIRKRNYQYEICMMASPCGIITSGKRDTEITVSNDDEPESTKDSHVRIYHMNFNNGYDSDFNHFLDISQADLIMDWSTLYSDGVNPLWFSAQSPKLRYPDSFGHIRINTHKKSGKIKDTNADVMVAYTDIYIAPNYATARAGAKNPEIHVMKYHIFYPKKRNSMSILYKSAFKNPQGHYNYILVINNFIKAGELGEVPDEIKYTPMEMVLLSDFVAEFMQLDADSSFYQVTPFITICTSPETIP